VALTQGVPFHTRETRLIGLHAFQRVCLSYGWLPPYIPPDDTQVALCRLLVVVHHLGHIQHLARDTVSNYMSSAKYHYTLVTGLFGAVSTVWGPKGKNHPLVSMLLQSIPYRHRPCKTILSFPWIHDGFLRTWTPHEYVAIALMRGWMLRSGEACATAWNGHLLMWSMVRFRIHIHHDIWSDLPMSQLRTRYCDLVELHPDSRKFRTEPSTMPGRVNITHLADPATGLDTWNNLDMASILQAWAIRNDIDHRHPTDLQTRPLLADPLTNSVISAHQVSQALKRHAVLRHEDPSTVMPHGLRMSAINDLAQGSLIHDELTYLNTVSHRSTAATQDYLKSFTPQTAALVTHATHPNPPYHNSCSSYNFE
jgi:hypothetical protein